MTGTGAKWVNYCLQKTQQYRGRNSRGWQQCSEEQIDVAMEVFLGMSCPKNKGVLWGPWASTRHAIKIQQIKVKQIKSTLLTRLLSNHKLFNRLKFNVMKQIWMEQDNDSIKLHLYKRFKTIDRKNYIYIYIYIGIYMLGTINYTKLK